MEFQVIVSLLSLIALEVVLGIDNVIFISILANKLPKHQQKRVRQIGLVLAAVMRIGLLLLISFILKLDADLFTVLQQGFSGKDLILIAGGLFLLYKSASEIYQKMEGETGNQTKHIKATSFGQVLIQILIMDLVFSIDSIITAIGMVKEVWVMYVAVVVTVGIMLVAAEPISNFAGLAIASCGRGDDGDGNSEAGQWRRIMTALKVLGWIIVVGVTVALYVVRIDATLARVSELDQLRASWLFYAVAMLVFVVGVALVLIGNSRGKK